MAQTRPRTSGEGQSRFRTPPEQYKHSIAELKAKLNEIMIKDCKLDACLDRFLVRVGEAFDPSLLSRTWEPQLPPFKSLENSHPEQLRQLKQDLVDDINRLRPDLTSISTENCLDLDEMRIRMEARWFKKKRNYRGEGRLISGSGLGTFEHTLLTTAARHNYQSKHGSHGQEDPTLQRTAFKAACEHLRNLIDGEQSSATFACGGSIAVKSDGAKEPLPAQSSAAVNIFWVDEDGSTSRRLVLPVDPNSEDLLRFVNDCYGTRSRKEDNPVDIDYAAPGKLDVSRFCCSFHPANHRIIEMVENILLPAASDTLEDYLGPRLTVELSQVNVHSSSSGSFPTYIDPKRSSSQIGSLVVCLPSSFQGGNLTVRHKTQRVDFDWSALSGDTIQWAAFYSDCIQETEKVTAGHRLTLVYNVHIAEPVGNPASLLIDPTTLPLYGYLENLIDNPAFMRDGGTLGIFCSHAYAHTSLTANLELPKTLKGSDIVIYSVLKALGIDVKVLPVLEDGGIYGYRNGDKLVSRRGGRVFQDEETSTGLSQYKKFLMDGSAPLQPTYEDISKDNFEDWDDIDSRWKILLMGRRVEGMKELLIQLEEDPTFPPFSEENEFKDFNLQGSRIGQNLHWYITSDLGYDEAVNWVAQEEWPHYYLSGITWITEPKHESAAYSQVVYGNEALVASRYSCAALIALIPPSFDRVRKSD